MLDRKRGLEMVVDKDKAKVKGSTGCGSVRQEAPFASVGNKDNRAEAEVSLPGKKSKVEDGAAAAAEQVFGKSDAGGTPSKTRVPLG